MHLPTDMEAVEVYEGKARLCRRPVVPMLADDELLIEVAWAGVNRADLFQLQGSYAPPAGATDILGLECAGRVVATGRQAGRFGVGDRVCALLSGGGYSSHVVAKAGHCLPIPDGLSLREAAALPECVATVWLALWQSAQLKAGEAVLVHGGASGIGTTAIQMLQAFGCPVFCTVGSEAKASATRALGADPIRYQDQDFVDYIAQKGGVDVVLDMVGGDYLARNLKVLKPRGRMVSLAFLHGAKAELSLGGLLMKQLSWHGITLRGRSDAEKAALMAAVEQVVWPWVAQGRVRPVIDSVWPLAEAAEALSHMEKSLHIGKILLEVGA